DYALDRDQKALAWAIRALVQYVPAQEKLLPEPPKKPKKPARRLSPAERRVYADRPSWNRLPKRDWEGPDLPLQLRPSLHRWIAPRRLQGLGRPGQTVRGRRWYLRCAARSGRPTRSARVARDVSAWPERSLVVRGAPPPAPEMLAPVGDEVR